MKWSWIFFVMGMYLIGCSGEKSHLKELSLLDKGFPITILAPDSAKVKVSNMAFMKDITVIDEASYNVQILVSKSTNNSSEELMGELKDQVNRNPYFSEIIEEQTDGFIFKNTIDSLDSYDFRHVKIKAGKEYIFQTGLSSNFNEEEVREMYKAVQYNKTAKN